MQTSGVKLARLMLFLGLYFSSGHLFAAASSLESSEGLVVRFINYLTVSHDPRAEEFLNFFDHNHSGIEQSPSQVLVNGKKLMQDFLVAIRQKDSLSGLDDDGQKLSFQIQRMPIGEVLRSQLRHNIHSLSDSDIALESSSVHVEYMMAESQYLLHQLCLGKSWEESPANDPLERLKRTQAVIFSVALLEILYLLAPEMNLNVNVYDEAGQSLHIKNSGTLLSVKKAAIHLDSSKRQAFRFLVTLALTQAIKYCASFDKKIPRKLVDDVIRTLLSDFSSYKGLPKLEAIDALCDLVMSYPRLFASGFIARILSCIEDFSKNLMATQSLEKTLDNFELTLSREEVLVILAKMIRMVGGIKSAYKYSFDQNYIKIFEEISKIQRVIFPRDNSVRDDPFRLFLPAALISVFLHDQQSLAKFFWASPDFGSKASEILEEVLDQNTPIAIKNKIRIDKYHHLEEKDLSLKGLFNSSEFSDLTLNINGKCFYLHRIVIASSKVLNNIVLRDLLVLKVENGIVFLDSKNYDPEAMEVILKYMYGFLYEELQQNMNLELLKKVLRLANKLLLFDLMAKCENTLSSQYLNTHTVSLFQFAYGFEPRYDLLRFMPFSGSLSDLNPFWGWSELHVTILQNLGDIQDRLIPDLKSKEDWGFFL